MLYWINEKSLTFAHCVKYKLDDCIIQEIEDAPKAEEAPVVQKSGRQVWKMLALSRQQKAMAAKPSKTPKTTASKKARNTKTERRR